MNFGLAIDMPTRVWVEMHEDKDACDVIVELEDGAYYTAFFVTLPYLQRQMRLSYEVGCQMHDTPAVRYAAMEVPHILVDNLNRDTIEDTIDNLLTLDTFETVFTRVIEDEDDAERKARTLETAAVVLTEVLRAEESTVA